MISSTSFFFILFFIIVLCLFTESYEHLEADVTTQDPQKLLKLNIPILGDSLFKDVATYMNDDLWVNKHGQTGIQKCIKKCEGNCVQYGYSGQAMCFTK